MIMETENDKHETTVVIEGQVSTSTTTNETQISDIVGNEPDVNAAPAPGGGNEELASSPETQGDDESNASTTNSPDSASESSGSSAQASQASTGEQQEFDPLEAITSLLVGGAIEGTSQLVSRLQQYQEQLRQEAAAAGGETATEDVDEDELVRLRYAMVGLIFDAQATFRRNLTLWAKVADRSARVTNRVARPVTNSFIFNPFKRRYNSLAKRGEESLARWIADGRVAEGPSRQLARRAYVEIIDEFIDRLAENPQLQLVITQQSMGVASDIRDEVRERTVTGDNMVEALVRRILRRKPRAQLPGPPQEVQRWAGLTLEEYRALSLADEAKDDASS